MVFVSIKKINNQKRYYLEKSIRLQDNKVKKISVYLKNYQSNKKYDLKPYKEKLDEKAIEELKNFASNFYKEDPIFNKETLKKLEEIKINYKKIIKKLNEKQLKDVIDRFTVNFTYESNAIEGNSLTLKDVTMVLQEKKVIEGKDLREIYETLNTRETMEMVFKNKFNMNKGGIIKLHEILVKNTNVSFGYKKLPNFLIGRNIKTTNPEKVEEEINNLIKEYHKKDNMHPLQKAAIFHSKFEKIHPFEDGNGRVGRLLINIMLLKKGYAPLIIRKNWRISYFSALEAFDNGHQDKLNRFLIEKYKNTYEKFFKVYIKYL